MFLSSEMKTMFGESQEFRKFQDYFKFAVSLYILFVNIRDRLPIKKRLGQAVEWRQWSELLTERNWRDSRLKCARDVQWINFKGKKWLLLLICEGFWFEIFEIL